MIDTKALRSRVLDLAIQGKLTEQLASDGTAEELYQQIQAEKQRLIKEGKLKKEKPLLEISDDEIPFEIPENWKWVRLNEISTIINGDRGKNYPAKSTLKHEGIPFISALNLNGRDVTVDEKLLCLSDEQYDKLGNGKLEKDDLVICIRGSLGKHGRYQFEKGAIASSLVISRIYVEKETLGTYEMIWLDSSMFPNEIARYDSGTAQPNLAAENLSKFLVPLPPLAEQKRIVARVEEIFRLLDTIDAAQAQYAANAESLKAKLITAGIQGRLTEQLDSDGTAEELYQQIQAEKQRLIQAGKIKKEKPLPDIKVEEVPFEIPENWKWVYLGEIFQHNTGKALNSANADGKLLEYITTSNVYWDRFELKSLKQMRFTDDEVEKCTITKGDLLICEGGDIGRSAIWCFDYDMRIQNHLHRLRGYIHEINAKYYYYLMMLYKDKGMIDGRGIGLQGFSSKRVHSLIVPLPPLAEQKRIAEMLERVLGVVR